MLEVIEVIVRSDSFLVGASGAGGEEARRAWCDGRGVSCLRGTFRFNRRAIWQLAHLSCYLSCSYLSSLLSYRRVMSSYLVEWQYSAVLLFSVADCGVHS